MSVYDDIGGWIAAEGEDGAGCVGTELGEPAAVGGKDGGGAVGQGDEQFGLGLDDVLDGAEKADVGAGDAGDDGGVGGGDAAVGLDFAADLRAHFDDGETVLGSKPGKGGGDADIGVLAAVGGEGEAVRAEGGGRACLVEVLPLLPVTPTKVARERSRRPRASFWKAARASGAVTWRQVGGRVGAAAEGCGGAAVEGVADVVVAIDALAGEGDEEHVGLDAAAVEVGGGNVRVRVPGGYGWPAAAYTSESLNMEVSRWGAERRRWRAGGRGWFGCGRVQWRPGGTSRGSGEGAADRRWRGWGWLCGGGGCGRGRWRRR